MPRRDPRRAQARRKGRRLIVRVTEVPDLAALAVSSVGEDPIDALEVKVDAWHRPKGWVGAPQLPGLRESAVAVDGAGARVDLVAAEAMDPALLLAAAVRLLRPHPTGDRGPLITLGPELPGSAASFADGLVDVTSTPAATSHLRRCDTLVVGDSGGAVDASVSALDRDRTVVVRESGRWTVTDSGGAAVDHEVVVDPRVHRPMGRRSDAACVIADGAVEGDVLAIRAPGLDLRVTGDLTEGDVIALRAVRGLRIAGELPHRWGAQLAACGLVVDGNGFPPANEHLAWLSRSVEASRHALRAHTPAAALDAWPTVSAVLVTHRTDHLAAIGPQLARLSYPKLQVVIGRHGDAIDRAQLDAALAPVRAAHGEVVVVDLDGALPFGAAMQAACARADGDLLTKLDDDDIYAPEHLWDLVIARMTSGAQLVGKALDWIHVASERMTAFRPVYAAEKFATFVAGGTLLISAADLAAVGRWRPVPKSIDRALIERVQMHGGLVYRTHGLGYVYVRRGDGHTAQVDDRHFLTKAVATWPGLVRDPALGTDLVTDTDVSGGTPA